MPPQNWIVKPRSKDEMACIYAALILADDDISITAEKITTLLSAANIEVESIWPSLFARALQGIDIRQMVAASIGAGGGVRPSGGATGQAAAGGATEEKKEEEEPKKEEPEEDSSDEDMGLGLFD